MRCTWALFVLVGIGMGMPLPTEAQHITDSGDEWVVVAYQDTDDSGAVEVAMVPQPHKDACTAYQQKVEATYKEVIAICLRSHQQILSTEPSGALIYAYLVSWTGETVTFSGPRNLNKCLEDYAVVVRQHGRDRVPFLCGVSAQEIVTPRYTDNPRQMVNLCLRAPLPGPSPTPDRPSCR